MKETYNGWKNYATWSVVLWLSNDEYYHSLCKNSANYEDLRVLLGNGGTPDNISWYHADLDIKALDELIAETA